MSDTGVSPGAGVGNKRMTLNKQTLGVPVLALGVPTVVDAATLINDTMDRMLEEMIAQTKKAVLLRNASVYGYRRKIQTYCRNIKILM